MKKTLSRFSLLIIILFSLFPRLHAQSIGINTTTPDASAALDIKSSTKGILIPRTSTTSRLAIVSPAKGLMLYDTITSSFWMHNGTAWQEMITGNSGWRLNGNNGTDTTINFIGTTDYKPLLFKINNVKAGLIATDTVANTAFGYFSLPSSSGKYNTATGFLSQSANTTGSFNTSLGYISL